LNADRAPQLKAVVMLLRVAGKMAMSETIRFYPSRMNWIVGTLACAIMTAASIWVIADGNWFGYVGTAFFGLGLVVSLLLLWPSSSFLELDDSGLLIRNLFRDSRFSWTAIEIFEARRLGVRKMVTFKFVPQYGESPSVRATAHALSGLEGGLPDTYGRSAEELALMLNEYLQKYRQSATHGHAT
jgi:hypothetical protein